MIQVAVIIIKKAFYTASGYPGFETTTEFPLYMSLKRPYLNPILSLQETAELVTIAHQLTFP